MSSIKMATIATQDVESLEWFYAHTINTGIISITIGIIIIGVLCFVHYAFGLLVPLGILVAYMVRWRLESALPASISSERKEYRS